MADSLWHDVDNYLSIVVYTFFAVATLGFALRRCVQGRQAGRDAKVDQAAPIDLEAAAAPSTRFVHLDNLKVLLTICVVVLHCILSFGAKGLGSWFTTFAPERPSYFKTLGCWVIDLGDSFCMGLFFLLSAYFMPGSYEKKGWLAFLQDKFYRLGIPTLACTILLYPLLLFWAVVVVDQLDVSAWDFWDFWNAISTVYPFYFITWFTFDLLLANCAYAAVRGCGKYCKRSRKNTVDSSSLGSKSSSRDASEMQMGCGTLSAMFIAAWLLLSGLTVALRNVQFRTFAITPVRNLPQYVAYFVFGLFSKRYRWLERMAEPGPWAKWAMRIAAFGSAGTLLGVYLAGYVGEPSWESHPGSTVFFPADLEVGNVNAWWFKWVVSPGLLYQLFGLSFTCVLLECAPRCLSVSNHVTQFMAAAAYTVYIIHPFVITPLFWCFKLMVGWKGADGPNMPPAYQQEYWIWLGFLFQAVVSNLIVWPLAGLLRKMPGLRTML